MSSVVFIFASITEFCTSGKSKAARGFGSGRSVSRVQIREVWAEVGTAGHRICRAKSLSLLKVFYFFPIVKNAPSRGPLQIVGCHPDVRRGIK